jgi:hypothetical protein
LSHIERFATGQFQSLKRTKDGKTILVPQPSDDPNDPLNVFGLRAVSLTTVVLGKKAHNSVRHCLLRRHSRYDFGLGSAIDRSNGPILA